MSWKFLLQKEMFGRAGIQLPPAVCVRELSSVHAPPWPWSLMAHFFLYTISPSSGKLELLLIHPTWAQCFSFLIALVSSCSPVWGGSIGEVDFIKCWGYSTYSHSGGRGWSWRTLTRKAKVLSLPPFAHCFITFTNSVTWWARWLPIAQNSHPSNIAGSLLREDLCL